MPTAVADPGRRLHVARHVTAEGSFEMVRTAPAARLASFVRSYCGYHERAALPAIRRELPGPMVVFILDLGPPLRLLDAAGKLHAQHAGGFAAGLDESFTSTQTQDGEQRGIQVDLSLTGAQAVFGLPMHELAGRIVRLDDLFGASVRELRARIEDTPDWGARFALLDRFFAARVGTTAAPTDWLTWAWQRIESSGGQVSVDTLAREVGYSRKHLTVSFRQRFGMAPKPLALLVRFDRAVRMLRARRGRDLAAVGLECGYFDQAHFIRDFRRYSGSTPGEYTLPWPVGE